MLCQPIAMFLYIYDFIDLYKMSNKRVCVSPHVFTLFSWFYKFFQRVQETPLKVPTFWTYIVPLFFSSNIYSNYSLLIEPLKNAPHASNQHITKMREWKNDGSKLPPPKKLGLSRCGKKPHIGSNERDKTDAKKYILLVQLGQISIKSIR